MTRRAGRRALVLGAGGALGGAWMVGALSVVEQVEGIDCREFDIIVGTSAGSVVAALLAGGASVEELADELEQAGSPELQGTGPVKAFDVHAALARMPRPVPLPANLALAIRSAFGTKPRRLMTVASGLAPRGRGDLTPVMELVASRHVGTAWPLRPNLYVVAMDYGSGRRMVFGPADAGQVALSAAVAASCAAPGFFPPVSIGGRRYVDGGATSMTNIDILADEAKLDEVLVLAPMAGLARRHYRTPAERADRLLRANVTRRLRKEIAVVAANGVQVRLLAPTQDDLVAMHYNVMNPARRRGVLLTAQRTTHDQLADSVATPAISATAGD